MTEPKHPAQAVSDIQANDCCVQYGFNDGTTLAGHVDALEADATASTVQDGEGGHPEHSRLFSSEWLDRFSTIYGTNAAMPALSVM